MRSTVGFVVIYRWKLRVEMEQPFREAWKEITELLMKKRGGLGSRLHQTEDAMWLAYAQWPSKELWEHSQKLGEVCPAASEKMRSSILETFAPVLLYPEEDLLAF